MANDKRARRRGLRRRDKETGAVLVEFALVAPLIFLLLFGIIDFSLLMFSYISVRQGTSAGAREVAVIGTSPPAAQSCTTAGSFAGIDNGEAQNMICYTKSHIGMNAANTRVSVWFNTTSCNGACYAAGDPVVVCTQYPASSTTRFFSSLLNNIVLTSKVETRIEDTDATMTVPFQENPLPGSSWPASCTTP
jgi:Flp pilus assembly protein TadG